MSHEIYEALISARLDGELSPEEEAGLEAHLAVCPRCRAAKSELEAVHRLLLDEAAVPPPGLTERIMADLPPQRKKAKVPWARRIAPLAAAAVVALVVIGVVKPSFNGGMPQEEYAMATETAVEETAETEEAAPEEPMEEAPAAEDSAAAPEPAAGAAGESAPQAAEPLSQSPVQPESQKPAAPPANAAEDAAEEADEAVPLETAAAGEILLTEPAAEESAEEPLTVTEGEPVSESAETDEVPGETGGGAESETIIDTQPSSSLTWQQARERLCEYLGEVPDDLTAQDMSPDGKSWLFATRGKQYAVDRLSGAVTLLSDGE